MLGFWMRWMGATVLGFAGGFVGFFVAIDAATGGRGPEAYGIPFEVAFPVLLGVAATLMGSLQWLVLRRRVPGSVLWIPATAIGVLGGGAVLATLVAVMGEPQTLIGSALSGAFHGLLVGAIVGSLQWLVIRNLDASRRWILVNPAALLIAGMIGDSVASYTDGGIGMMIMFPLWQALVAPALYRLTTSRSSETGEGWPAASPSSQL